MELAACIVWFLIYATTAFLAGRLCCGLIAYSLNCDPMQVGVSWLDVLFVVFSGVLSVASSIAAVHVIVRFLCY